MFNIQYSYICTFNYEGTTEEHTHNRSDNISNFLRHSIDNILLILVGNYASTKHYFWTYKDEKKTDSDVLHQKIRTMNIQERGEFIN